ncbi:MAG: hemin uptake protein HemP [Hydrogenophaga sp.]|nr:hemin uptake protein HemP [Hydrogenophaga sp.]
MGATAEQPQPSGSTAAALPSQDLLRGQKTVVIEHNGTVYRLQSTRAGKLILTK